MALWYDYALDANHHLDEHNGRIDFSWLGTDPNNVAQQPGSTILDISGVAYKKDDGTHYDPTVVFQGQPYANYDWPRIVAVVVDEPYLHEVGEGINPCDSTPERHATFLIMAAQLADMAAVIKQKSPKTRFWVNFSKPELDWMKQGCPLNQSYIDVVSLDKYDTPFYNGVKEYYDWLVAHRATPTQQLALVPGTFYNLDDAVGAGGSRVAWLQEYFDYANDINIDSAYRAGAGFDEPLVWLVAGWAGVAKHLFWEEDACYNHPEVTCTTGGILDDVEPMPTMLEIWKDEFALPIAPPLSNLDLPGKAMVPAINLLLN